MRWIDIIRIAVRMAQANRLRGILTVLGIGVAISLIVFLMGFGYGLQEITIGSIVHSKNALSLQVTPVADSGVAFTSAAVPQIKSVSGIAELTPVVSTSGELQVGSTRGAMAVIAAQDNYLAMDGILLEEGSNYVDGKQGIVISAQALDLLGLTKDTAVGTPVQLSYADPNDSNHSLTVDGLTIVGVSGEGDTPTAYIPYSLLGNAVLPLTSVEAVATSRDAVISARDTLMQRGYQVDTLLDTLDQARKVFSWVTLGLLLFGLIAVIVAGIGMFNTLTIALLERTKDFGVMKAIGVTDRTIRRLFLTEAGLLGFTGGLVGVGGALIVDRLFGDVLNQILVRYGGTELNIFYYPTGFLLIMVLFPILLGLLTGLYPAIRAAKLNPLKALRYE